MNIDIRDRNTQIGIGLLVVGLLALFGNLGWFVDAGRLVGMAMFLVAGALVLRMYRDDPSKVWTLPVGFGLLGLGLATLDMPWSGGAFLGSLGLGFVAVFLTDRERWWALIPGGVLLTLGLTATYDEWLRPGADGGTIFFLGLAATFAVLYLLPSVNQRWAIWPALVLAVIGVLTMSFQGGWVLPIVLILVGAWMLSRQSRPSEVPPTGSTGTGTGTGGGTTGPGPSGGATGGTTGGTSGGTTGGTTAGTTGGGTGATTYGEATSPTGPSVRTPAQTPGTAAVQPTGRVETPDTAARRHAEPDAPTPTPKPTPTSAPNPAASDLPPYGQEPEDPIAGSEGGRSEGPSEAGGSDGRTDSNGVDRRAGEGERREDDRRS